MVSYNKKWWRIVLKDVVYRISWSLMSDCNVLTCFYVYIVYKLIFCFFLNFIFVFCKDIKAIFRFCIYYLQLYFPAFFIFCDSDLLTLFPLFTLHFYFWLIAVVFVVIAVWSTWALAVSNASIFVCNVIKVDLMFYFAIIFFCLYIFAITLPLPLNKIKTKKKYSLLNKLEPGTNRPFSHP